VLNGQVSAESWVKCECRRHGWRERPRPAKVDRPSASPGRPQAGEGMRPVGGGAWPWRQRVGYQISDGALPGEPL